MDQQTGAIVDTDSWNEGPALRLCGCQGWITVGSVRLSAGEHELLLMLIARPELQAANNAEIEQALACHYITSMSDAIDELVRKGLLIVYPGNLPTSRTRPQSRRLCPTVAALEGMTNLP